MVMLPFTIENIDNKADYNAANKFDRKNFNFSKSFNPSISYYTYAIKDLNSRESFLLDIIFYAKYMLNVSKAKTVSFDFSFDWANNNNSDNFYASFNSIQSEINNIVSLIESNTYYDTDLDIELSYAEHIKDTTNSRTIVILTFTNK